MWGTGKEEMLRVGNALPGWNFIGLNLVPLTTLVGECKLPGRTMFL
jgi:hypothetical protein